jgi:branched-chain amino acid transport system substrate-binding protein
MKPLRASAVTITILFLTIAIITAGASSSLAQNVIRIGGVQPLTGKFAFAGKQINAGLEDALMMANQEGGINGKRIEYIVRDGQYTLDVAKPLFQRIYTEFKPVAMYGESTALGKALALDIKNVYKVLYSSASFSGELADEAMNPSIFVPGPTYGDQIGLLLMHIAKQKKGARVAFFYSDTAFGRDPIKFGRIMCRRLRLNLVGEVSAKVGQADVSAEVAELKKLNPEYVIVHGFVLAPVPALIQGARDAGMNCQFMGTFWGMTKMLLDKLGPLADGYMGVNPYSYWWMQDVPMIKKIRAYSATTHPDVTYRPNSYMQAFATGLIFVEVLRRADEAGKLDFDGMVKALRSLEDFETGGLTAPLTIKNNRFPVARIWKANTAKGTFEPVSDWMTLR